MKRFYFLLVTPLLLGGCSLTKKEQKIETKNIQIPEADHEYFEVDKYLINWDDIFLQNIDNYYVYIYSQTCSHCQQLKNWIISEALKRGDIFFVKGSMKDSLSSDVSNTIGATSIDNLSIEGYPTLLRIEEKTLVKNVAGNSKILELLY